MGIFKKEQFNKEKEGFEKEKEEKEIFFEKQKEKEKKPEEAMISDYELGSDDIEKKKIEQEADKLREIKFEARKLEHLIALAKEKGAKYAVGVAKKTNDACLLDLLHDKLIEQGIEQ